MNATPISSPDLLQGQNSDSDTDSNPDDSPEYYQPISSVDDRDGLDEDSDHANSDGEHQEEIDSHSIPNGYCEEHEAAYGISSVHLNDEEKSGIDDDEEVEQERMGEAEMLRAFREDESRRNAPLPSENAARVMEAMRGISFTGLAPDWAGRVPEDQWVDQIRSRRNAPPLPSENAARVMEAMRGISFTGSAPDWAGRVPEDQWVDQIRSRRRQQPST